jgi:hypothetical protein
LLSVFWYWGLNSGPSPWATPPALFLWRVFEISAWTVCPGWLQNMILLISDYWVARITGVSHWHLANFLHFIRPQWNETRNHQQDKNREDIQTFGVWPIQFLNDLWVFKEIRAEISEFLRANENEDITKENLLDTMKADLRESL